MKRKENMALHYFVNVVVERCSDSFGVSIRCQAEIELIENLKLHSIVRLSNFLLKTEKVLGQSPLYSQ